MFSEVCHEPEVCKGKEMVSLIQEKETAESVAQRFPS